MAVTTKPRTSKQKTIYIVSGTGATLEVKTKGGLTWTPPFRAKINYRETGRLVQEPSDGEEAPGTVTFDVYDRDVTDASSTTLYGALLWTGTYARGNWTTTNAATISATDVDDCNTTPLVTIRSVDPGCEGSDAETLEFRKAYPSGAPSFTPAEDGSGGTTSWTLEYYEFNSSRS